MSSALSDKPVAVVVPSQHFLPHYEKLKDEFLGEVAKLEIPESISTWINSMCDYNVIGGKMNRGLSVVETFLIMKKGSCTDKELEPYVVLGWCIELLQASFLIADDIMDASLSRRGKPCWYLKENVKMIAINDCFLLQSILFRILKIHFGHCQDCYVRLFDLFCDIRLRTELGQLLDLLTAPPPSEGPCNLNRFTPEVYRKIVRHKTAYYSFYLPVVSALTALEALDTIVPLTDLENILIDLGEFFQIQDDFLDCYGDPTVTGKIGTDIIEGKCTWLITTALSSPKMTVEIRDEISQHYGRKDPTSEAIIKDIYSKLDLKSEYLSFEQQSEGRIRNLISDFSKTRETLGQVLDSFASRIFGRKK